MDALPAIVLAVIAAAAAYVGLRVSAQRHGAQRKPPGTPRTPRTGIERAMVLAVLLIVSCVLTWRMFGGRAWALAVVIAGLPLLVAGVRLARNHNGEAEAVARRLWNDQGLYVSQPIMAARLMGAVTAGIGLVASMFAALWLFIGD